MAHHFNLDTENGFIGALSVEVFACESTVALETAIELDLTPCGRSSTLSARVRNAGETGVHLKTVRLTLDTKELNLNASRVFVGSSRMGESLKRYQPANTPFDVTSENFLLIRRDLSDYIFAGFLTWKIFLGHFILKDGLIIIYFHGDNKFILPGAEVSLEKIMLMKGGDWQETLKHYADRLKTTNNVLVKDCAWRGWGSFDYYGVDICARQIIENVTEMKRLGVPANLVQIDDGYQTLYGDWLDVKKHGFPDGMRHVTRKIEDAGYVPGIWIAPFYAHKDSRLAREHPDWILKNGKGEWFDVALPNLILDYSIGEVREWLKGILMTMKNEWRIKYFKIDFLCSGLEPCASSIDGVTPLERFRLCLETMRSALGSEVYIVGCSAIFGPCIGFVDGMRTGADINPNFDSVRKTFADDVSSCFLHKKVYNCDPDYLVLRAEKDEDAECCLHSVKRGSLTLAEAKIWADFLSVFGNAVIAGDKMSSLRQERRDLLVRAFSFDAPDECVPLDLWAGGTVDAPSLLLSKSRRGTLLALFNWEDRSIEAQVAGFGGNDALYSVADGVKHDVENGLFTTLIGGRSSLLFRYEGSKDHAYLCGNLSVNRDEKNEIFPVIIGDCFKPRGEAVNIEISGSAEYPLALDRLGGRGMLGGKFAGVAGQKKVLGVPFTFHETERDCVIGISNHEPFKRIMVPVRRALHTLYFLHACHHATDGRLSKYLVHFQEKIVEISLDLGSHIGNTEAKYSLPWRSDAARIAWHDPQTDACLYLLEWKSTWPDEIIESIEVTAPIQSAKLFLVGITGYAA